MKATNLYAMEHSTTRTELDGDVLEIITPHMASKRQFSFYHAKIEGQYRSMHLPVIILD